MIKPIDSAKMLKLFFILPIRSKLMIYPIDFLNPDINDLSTDGFY